MNTSYVLGTTNPLTEAMKFLTCEEDGYVLSSNIEGAIVYETELDAKAHLYELQDLGTNTTLSHYDIQSLEICAKYNKEE